MTQEELDKLMSEGIDEEVEELNENKEQNDSENKDELMENFRVDPDNPWPPPPPTEEHKVVGQLDDVTRDSEVKATEIFEKLEHINDWLMDIEDVSSKIDEVLDKNIEIFDILSAKFPKVSHFLEHLNINKEAKESLDKIIEDSRQSADEVMMIMDIMQYQDIHRQKIERVINVMRALAKYMNTLFEGKVDDSKRVSSAVHIVGDETEDVVSNEDIEALIASLGKK